MRNKIIGLGLKANINTNTSLSDKKLEYILQRYAADGDRFLQSLGEDQYLAVYNAWRAHNPAARIAMLPYGKFSRHIALHAAPGSTPDFYDRHDDIVAKYEDITACKYGYFLVSSLAYQAELRMMLLRMGIHDHQIFLTSHLLQHINSIHSLENIKRIASLTLEMRESGKTPAAMTFSGDGIELIDKVLANDGKLDLFIDPLYVDLPHENHIRPMDLRSQPTSPHLVVTTKPERYKAVYKDLVLNNKVENNIIFPYYQTGEFPAEDFSDGTPALIYMPAFAGAGRLGPTIQDLARKLGRTERHFREANNNSVLLDQHWDKGQELPTKLRHDNLRGACLFIHYYEYSIAHFPYNMELLADLTWIKFLALIRDPRDMINSFVFRAMGGAPGTEYEEIALRALDGCMLGASPVWLFHWPSLRDLLDSFLAVAHNEHMRFIRFEDIHADPKTAYRDALQWLGWLPDPFAELDEESLEKSIYLGSFQHQTGGKRRRGEEQRERVLGQSCRKGVVGDWKNHWSKRLNDRYLEIAGDSLAVLGYQ